MTALTARLRARRGACGGHADAGADAAAGIGGIGVRARPASVGPRSRAPTLAPVGTVYAAGEEWTARTAGGELASNAARPCGSSARTGSTLIVEPLVAGRRSPASSSATVTI